MKKRFATQKNANSFDMKGGNVIKMRTRKSSFDVDNAVNVISGIFFAGILLVVLLLVIAIIFGLTLWTTYGLQNNTTTIQNNLIGLAVNFFALAPTIGTILGVVILIAAIVLLVLYVRRMAKQGQETTGFQG